MLDWKEMPDGKEKRHAYYCSREWAAIKEQVHERAGGMCERCLRNRIDSVHHLTYIRMYRERIEDLQGICEGCHQYTHKKSDIDPAAWIGKRAAARRLFAPEHELFIVEFLYSSPIANWRADLIDEPNFTNLGLRYLFGLTGSREFDSFFPDDQFDKAHAIDHVSKTVKQAVLLHSALAAIHILDWPNTEILIPPAKSALVVFDESIKQLQKGR